MTRQDTNAAVNHSVVPLPSDPRFTEELFRSFTENIEQIVWMTDVASGELLYINSAYERIFGVPLSAIYADANSFLELVHPEDRASVRRYIERRKFGQVAEQYYRIIRKDGSIRWIWARAYPVLNDAGEFYRMIGIVQDITERKLLEEELLHTKKMQAIGELAGGIAHDFNNLLTPILGYSSLLLRGKVTEARVKRIAGVIQQAATRASELTQQLLVFGRKGKQQNVAVDLHRTLDEVIELAERTFEKRVQIIREFADERLIVQGDPGQMHQVFLNLAINSRDALASRDGDGWIRVSTRLLAQADDVRQQQLACVSVADNGIGMDTATKARIFEPFFTTKSPGQGTGLGLATVYGIVSNHGGTISVESRPGEGSSFSVYLPLNTSEQAPDNEVIRPMLSAASASVLIIDDDPQVCALAQDLLQELGCTVVAITDSREAIEYYRLNYESIDLVLLDMLMPNLNGRECFQELARINSDIRALISSGCHNDAEGSPLLEAPGVVGFLQKPYTIEQLAEVIEQSALRPAERAQ